LTADPSNPLRQSDVAWSHMNVGDALLAAGQIEPAKAEYEQSSSIRQGLIDHDRANLQWQRDLTLSIDRVGNALQVRGNPGDLQDALTEYRLSLDMRTKLVASDETNFEWQADLARSYTQVGEILLSTHDLPDAEAAFRQSLSICRTLTGKDPNAALWKSDLAMSELNLADGLLAENNLDEAKVDYAESLGILQQLADADPLDSEWKVDLANGLYKAALAGESPHDNLVEALGIVNALETAGLLPAPKASLKTAIEEQLAKVGN
jgi:tetratricopeptide (TPR) repeat protein